MCCFICLQILLDAGTVFNMVFSLSQKEQSAKFTQDGIEVVSLLLTECVWCRLIPLFSLLVDNFLFLTFLGCFNFQVFREYYPMNERSILLDCVWETDKFVLHERSTNCKTERVGKNVGEISIGPSAIQYQSIEVLLGGKNVLFNLHCWSMVTQLYSIC